MTDENNFEQYKGKKVFIVLKNGMVYNGIIKEATNSFIFISDKFNKPVTISISEISSLGEKE